MDSRSQSVGDNRVYEDFEPDFQWEKDEKAATLVVSLPGFRRDQLKVQVTSTPTVRITGERQTIDNKRRRIAKEFSIPSECDTDEVTAKFEGGKLYIKFSIKAPKPQLSEDSSKPRDQNDKAEAKSKPRNEVSDLQKEEEGQREEEQKKKKKVTTTDVVEKIPSSTETIASKNGESFRASSSQPQGLMKRTKTRVLDYTISLKSSFESEDFKKPKNMVNIILLILFGVVLAIYVQQAFRSFLGVISKFRG